MFSLLRARRPTGLLVALIVLLGVFAAPAAAAESRLPGTFRGAAWGNSGNAASGEIGTRLGRSAYIGCPCRGTGGQILSSSQDNIDSGDSYRSKKIVSTVQAEKQTSLRAFGQSTSRATNISALGGRITVGSLQAVATMNATSTSIQASPEGSAITGLRVNGIARSVGRSARIGVPGFGYVQFYNVQLYGDGVNLRGVRVDMMRIVITRENNLKIPVGSVLTAAHAEFGYQRQETRGVVSAAAWGSEATSSSTTVKNAMGRSAPAYLVCLSKGTATGGNRVNGTTVPTVLSTDGITNAVSGAVSTTSATSTAISRLENVNFMNGVLTADVIRGVAKVTLDSAGGKTSFAGSKFVNLRVLGRLVGDDVAPNTKFTIPGLGTLTLYSTQASHDSDDATAVVIMVLLNVNLANAHGIPVGTQYRLARAGAIATT
jgi:hypothetical protein